MRIQSAHVVSSDPFDQGLGFAVPVQKTLQCIASGTLSGSFSTPPISVLHADMWSATVVTTDVIGTATWDVSNDSSGNNEYATLSVKNWVEFPNIETVMSGTGDMTVWNMRQRAERWVRFRWIHTSGTGSIDVYLTAKGPA